MPRSRTAKPARRTSARLRILVLDVGGTHVKCLVSGKPLTASRKFASGPTMTPGRMVAGVKQLTADWAYDVISIGFPGPIVHGRIVTEPANLGHGWVRFDFSRAFGRPIKLINDAAMQALGSYKGGRMLFLGLGTGLGSAVIDEGLVEPMELAHLPYRKATFEDYVGIRGLEKHGLHKWRHYVADVVERLTHALEPDDVVLGGGNVNRLKTLPPLCRAGNNSNAFLGGFELWSARVNSNAANRRTATAPVTRGTRRP